MRIHVRSKSQVECGDVPDAPHVIVSIYTLESDRANTLKCKNAVDVLYQGFADLERLPALGSATEAYFEGVPIVLFGRKHAREIKAFVQRHLKEGIEDIVFQCEMGISRSAGLAAAFAEHYLGDATAYLAKEGCRPNPRVHSCMLRMLGYK